MNFLRAALVTVFGAGLSPVAPGTAGTFMSLAIMAGLYLLLGGGSTPGRLAWELTLVGLILIGSLITVALGPWAARHYRRDDPGPCVADELAGTAVTALALPLLPIAQMWPAALAVFLAFRIFDVLKPPPARQLESLPQGWGILADDLMAGVYANVACQLALRLLLAT